MQYRLSICLAMLALTASVPSTAFGLEVRLDLRTSQPLLDGELVVRHPANAGDETIRPLMDGILPAPDERALVTCRGEGLWCPEVRVVSNLVTLPVFAEMNVTGTLAGPEAGAVLAESTVQGVVRTAGRGEHIEFRSTVSLDGRQLTFTAPWAELDLRFAFPGAAPVYLWGISPPPLDASPAALELGTLSLHAGGSLSGWVRQREDEFPVTGATVAAFPVTSNTDESPPLHTWKGATDERGFFQIRSLQAGTYRLELSSEGRVPQVLDSVEIEQAAETLIGTVLLSPPVRLSIALDPPRHPDGTAWALVFSPVRRLPEELPVEVTAAADGTVDVFPLRPAEYYVNVQGSDRNLLLVETWEVTGDEWRTLDVPVVAVTGRVRLGGDPIAAALKLETGAGDRVELSTDDEGRLSGWMRRPQRAWLMASMTWREADQERRRVIEVIPSLDDEAIELEIDLPAGVVYGDVVDAEGRPQRGMRVLAWPADGASRLTEVRGETDDSGRFHLTGLESAQYFLQAGGLGGATSEVASVDLGRDLPSGEVRLIVEPTRKLIVQVTADGQAVAGASVSVEAFGRVPISLASTTGSQGTVVLNVPESVERAVMTVDAPSRLLWSGCRSIREERLSLVLPALPPGVLSLRISGRSDLPPAIDGQAVVLTSDGGFLSYQQLINWNRLRNAERAVTTDGEHVAQVIQLPAVSPESYAVTWSAAPTWELAARACAGAFSELDWVTLAPRGEAELSLDTGKQQAMRLQRLNEGSDR